MVVVVELAAARQVGVGERTGVRHEHSPRSSKHTNRFSSTNTLNMNLEPAYILSACVSSRLVLVQNLSRLQDLHIFPQKNCNSLGLHGHVNL